MTLDGSRTTGSCSFAARIMYLREIKKTRRAYRAPNRILFNLWSTTSYGARLLLREKKKEGIENSIRTGVQRDGRIGGRIPNSQKNKLQLRDYVANYALFTKSC